MKFDAFNVYERPVAEIVSLTVESPIAESQFEEIDDPGTETVI